jgi:hypothetical protein
VTLSVAVPQPAAAGQLQLDAGTATATFTPAPGFVGAVSLTYRMCRQLAPTSCSQGLVTVHVLA